ncbi:MAG: outer membrane beta-barrel family protein, partial [Saprospiraceae bacterium]
DLTAGTRTHRGNVNFNYGKGRFGFHLSGGGHYNRPHEGETYLEREELGTHPSILRQEGINIGSRLGYRGNSGIEFNVNEISSLNATFSMRNFENKNESTLASVYTVDNVLFDKYERFADGVSGRNGWDAEIDYKINPGEKREWSVAFKVDHDVNKTDYTYNQDYKYPIGLESTLEENHNSRNNMEITAQTDLVQPLSKSLVLETGIKGTLRQLESDFSFNLFDPDLEVWNEDPVRTDIFYYDQNVYAGYASMTFGFGKSISLITGARYELTTLKGSFEEFDSPFENEYSNVLPNLTLAAKVGEYNQLKASYTQRIQRPSQRHVNPFIEYTDNRDISFGNPSLFPELIHQVELGSTFFINGSMISTFVFGRRTEDLIENLLTINDNGVSESTYYNFGKKSAIGINVFGSLNIGDLSLRGGFDVNAFEVEGNFGNEFLSNTGHDFNGRMNITWAISGTFRVEGFSFYQSPTYTVQGRTPNWTMMGFGLKKEFLKRRLILGLNFTEPFRENNILIRELESSDFYQYSRTSRPVRSFGINLGYRFGKLDFKERSGKKKVNNNDLKDDDRGNETQF